MEDQSIAPRLTIQDAVSVYERATAQIRSGFAAISDAEQLLTQTFIMGETGNISIGRHDFCGFDDAGGALRQIRTDIWAALIERLELRRMMSIKRSKELAQQLKDHELPEITIENVRKLLTGFQDGLPEMLNEAVQEVFEWLRPRSSRYKTNTELEIGPRVILGWVVERWTSNWHVNYHYEANLTALENVFNALDGRGQINKHCSGSELSNAIRAADASGSGETPLFRFQCYKNRNLHLEFKRTDLLARFNAIAGGKRLRPAAAGEQR